MSDCTCSTVYRLTNPFCPIHGVDAVSGASTGGYSMPEGFVMPTRNELAQGNGWIAASEGRSILANPYTQGSSDFNYWVDGWCEFHSTDKP